MQQRQSWCLEENRREKRWGNQMEGRGNQTEGEENQIEGRGNQMAVG